MEDAPDPAVTVIVCSLVTVTVNCPQPLDAVATVGELASPEEAVGGNDVAALEDLGYINELPRVVPFWRGGFQSTASRVCTQDRAGANPRAFCLAATRRAC